jgi:hypothetical protein
MPGKRTESLFPQQLARDFRRFLVGAAGTVPVLFNLRFGRVLNSYGPWTARLNSQPTPWHREHGALCSTPIA